MICITLTRHYLSMILVNGECEMILRAGGKLLAFALSRLGTHQSETKIRGFSVYKIVRYVG